MRIDEVPVKFEQHQAVAALHRIRSGYLQTRTARINAVRGHLREYGVNIPAGARRVVPAARAALEQGAVPEMLTEILDGLLDDIERLELRAKDIEKRLGRLSREIPEIELLQTVPGIGLLTATALFAFVGDIHRFGSCRSFADYLGLTPREHSTGHVRRLGRITKRGNSYLRMLLIHGARSALRAGMTTDEPDDLRAWALRIRSRRNFNLAAVALANKSRSRRVENLDRWATLREPRSGLTTIPSIHRPTHDPGGHHHRTALRRHRWQTGRSGAGTSR